jgi:transcriptional regulator with XRE-family HTH domain
MQRQRRPTLEALRRARVDAGLTISELAKRAGVSRDTISHAERGRHSLQGPTLSKIARALGRAPSELLAEEERLAPKAEGRSALEPSLNDLLEEERREEIGAPMPEPSGRHISVRIADDLSTEPARVEITYEAFLNVLKRHGLTRRAAEEAFEEIEELQRSA